MPLLLHYGDNTPEIDEAVRAVRERYDSADTVLLDGPTMPISAFTEACLTAGLFAPERLVVVTALHERGKGSRKENPEAAEVRSLLASIVPTTTLLLVGPGMPSDHSLISDVRKAGGEAHAHMMPKRSELPRWIVARARKAGVSIQPQAAELLADLVGNNPLLLQSEIEKLATFAGGETIEAPMVDSLVGAVPQDTIFALVYAIADGNRAGALQMLHAQLDAATAGPVDYALYLIRMLARQARILLRIRLGQQAGRSQSQIVSDLKLPRYYADRYFRQSRRFSTQRLVASFDLLAGLEHGLKSGRAEPASGLDLLVADLCA